MTKNITPIVGLTACFFHPDNKRNIFKGKRLLYAEAQMTQLVKRHGGIPFILPEPDGYLSVEKIVASIGGLLLQGGSDVSPRSYGESAIQEKWQGDYYRDQYEITLVKEAIKQRKPILGICRGLQLLNTAFGGTLVQDIPTQLRSQYTHRDPDIYDQCQHPIVIEPTSYLAKLYPHEKVVKVNSIHHQCIKDLAGNLIVEALSQEEEKIIEAVRHQDDDLFCYGFQWHPEFQDPQINNFTSSFYPSKVIDEFMARAKDCS